MNLLGRGENVLLVDLGLLQLALVEALDLLDAGLVRHGELQRERERGGGGRGQHKKQQTTKRNGRLKAAEQSKAAETHLFVWKEKKLPV